MDIKIMVSGGTDIDSIDSPEVPGKGDRVVLQDGTRATVDAVDWHQTPTGLLPIVQCKRDD